MARVNKGARGGTFGFLKGGRGVKEENEATSDTAVGARGVMGGTCVGTERGRRVAMM